MSRFALPHPHQALGLPIGQHISLRAEDEGSEGPMLLRPYTPVSTLEQTGLVDFVIKVASSAFLKALSESGLCAAHGVGFLLRVPCRFSASLTALGPSWRGECCCSGGMFCVARISSLTWAGGLIHPGELFCNDRYCLTGLLSVAGWTS